MATKRRKVILVFGENDNDRASLIELAMAIKPGAKVVYLKRAKPLVLLRTTEKKATRRRAAEEIAALVKAASVTDDVLAVIAHRDCDAVEPAHVELAGSIESELKAAGVAVPIAAAPAYEMEAWWYLFPKAVAAVRACWCELPDNTRHVGGIVSPKEQLRRDLRPKDAKRKGACPAYAESDSVSIARKVREMALLTKDICARSGSLDEFRGKIADLKF